MSMHVCVSMCVCVCARACVHVCVCIQYYQRKQCSTFVCMVAFMIGNDLLPFRNFSVLPFHTNFFVLPLQGSGA